MAKQPCPLCGVRHSKPPRGCIEAVRSDNTFNYIVWDKRSEKTEAHKAAEAKWNEMLTYGQTNGWLGRQGEMI